MKKAIQINDSILVFETIPKKWNGEVMNSEEDYYNIGFRDFIEPQLLDGLSYGNMYRDLNSDTFTIEIVEYPTINEFQKLGDKIQNETTGVYTYSVIDK